MNKDLKEAFSKDNLSLSWKWINSNTESAYKNYFRTIYKSYALSLDDNLKDLRKELFESKYEPENSIKVFLPKKSGILRPFTLLCIKDQIVYQALINVVAEKLYKKIDKNYQKSSFGHIYAGKKSVFFYKKWKKGYSDFNKGISSSFKLGYKYIANFDLTACYDSIDHKVLRHFLLKLDLEIEFIDMLIICLEKWTANQPHNIFLGHGIPQGPLSSGLLAEVVLKEFENKEYFKSLDIKYFRYVDDIKLMAISELNLRKALISLDMTSKRIGLFPQSNKINIHEITNIDIEIKDISFPEINDIIKIDQAKVLKRLSEITYNNEIKDETSFKYLLSNANPTHKLNEKLLILIDKYPHLYVTIMSYFNKYKKFPDSVSNKIFELTSKSIGLYEELTAYYLKISFNKVSDNLKDKFLYECEILRLNQNNLESSNLKLVLQIWHLNNQRVKYSELEKILEEQDWWVIQGLIEFIDIDLYGTPTYEEILNKLLCHKKDEVALNAAYYIIHNNLDITKKIIEINSKAQIPLKSLGKIGKTIKHNIFITKCLNYILNHEFDENIKWEKIIIQTTDLKICEMQIFQCKSYFFTDPSAFINSLDVFNDILIHYLTKHDPNMTTCDVGKFGRLLGKPTSRFSVSYPKFYYLVEKVHKFRGLSSLSHPKVKSTGKATRRITFKEIHQLRSILIDGYSEYIQALKIY